MPISQQPNKVETRGKAIPPVVHLGESAETLSDHFRTFVGEVKEYAIFMMDPHGIITTWNVGAETMKGWTAEEAIGQHYRFLYVPEQRERGEPEDHLEQCARDGTFEQVSVRMRKSGEVFDAKVSLTPSYDQDGSIRGFLKVTQDVTPQKKLEAELRDAKTGAEAANRAKDQFIAMLSHELRRPLGPIIAATALLLKDPNVPSLIRDDLEMIRRNAELEARLIDDLLDVTKLDRGKVELHHEAVDVHALVKHALETCAAQNKRVELTTSLWATRHHVWGDNTRLHQVFSNVVCNAYKFTPEGGSIRIKTEDAGDGHVSVTVQDSGIGMTPDTLSRIFTAFDQGEGTIQRRFGGLGLGLTISKSLVDLHGGTIEVRSEGEGKGTTFVLAFKTISTQATVDASPDVKGGCDGRILLVDDHPDTLKITARMLRSDRYVLSTASTVKEAQQIIAESPDITLIVSDIGLPDGTGMDVMRYAKSRKPSVRGIALSGYGMEEDRRRSIEAGFEAHIVKPLNFEHLNTLIRSICT